MEKILEGVVIFDYNEGDSVDVGYNLNNLPLPFKGDWKQVKWFSLIKENNLILKKLLKL